MQLAIPHAPRPVKLGQVPGALRRLSVAAGLGAGICLLLVFSAGRAGGWASEERAFLLRAEEVAATVARVRLPPLDERERSDAALDVLYVQGGLSRSASGVAAQALYAEGLGPGAQVRLLVDPDAPERPREIRWVKARAGLVWLVPAAAGLGVLFAAAAVGWELRRAWRRELEPLRVGALVWLTPDEPLGSERREISFGASYLRGDVRHTVRVRGRPGRAPVRNGPKVLGAVLPREPGWARMVDEDLARTLGWVR